MQLRRSLLAGAAAVACSVVAAVAGRASGGLEDPPQAVMPVPQKAGETAVEGAAMRRQLATRRAVVGTSGALAGKTIYVAAGHGWVWREATSVWRTQRGTTHGLIEDLVAAETVSDLLIPMLQNMGAYVVPVRESDRNTSLVVVDDVAAEVQGGLVLTELAQGYRRLPEPLTGAANPFLGGSSQLFAATEGEAGRLTWTFDVPADGAYNVYVSYVQDGSRAADAHYIVHHAGGDSHVRVDQRRHGGTWVLLGNYWFEAGRSPVLGAISLVSDSATPGALLSADAVRIGGGMGVIDRGGGVSGRPRYEEAARYAVQLLGAPPDVYDGIDVDGADDVTARPRFAAWDHPDGEDAVYIAWHTNAPAPERGTTSFVYGPTEYGPLTEFTGVPGSIELATAVHQELIGDIRVGWDAMWQDRGVNTAFLGELNPEHNSEMPSALFEVAFHDTAEDALALRDPRFRYLAARAIAQGVARYFATRDGAEVVLPPEPPLALHMGQAPGGLRVSWQPPMTDAASGGEASSYRVYTSLDGRAFDDGVEVAATELVLPVVDAAPRYVRVAAVNAGGESLPSVVVGARRSAASVARVLVVNGFERLDRGMVLSEDLSAYDRGVVDRVDRARMNDGSYIARYGEAIAAAQVSFDSAIGQAVATGAVELEDYAAVVWFFGEEDSIWEPLAPASRQALQGYLAAGGRVLLTGTELARVLGGEGVMADVDFLRDALGTVFVADDANSYQATALPGPFAGLEPIDFGVSEPGSYDADSPDILAAAPGSMAVLAYRGGLGGAAAILAQDDAGGARALVLGFPLETVASAEQRAAIMKRGLDALGVEPEPLDGSPTPAEPSANGDKGDSGCGCRAADPAPSILVGLWLVWLVCRRRRRH